MNHEHRQDGGNGTGFKTKWVFIAFLAIAAYLLIMEHQAHLSGLLYYLPYLLLLACPLLHIFMHGGHGNHHNNGSMQPDKQREGEKK
ncbi:MAG: DUF2933 domain-containing protein [Burkholderiales bacterium]|nr:DUF2933 domain-containing protein [Burkholderiales bacterium]